MQTLSSFIDTWNKIMLLASASQVAVKDRLTYLEDIVEQSSDADIMSEFHFF